MSVIERPLVSDQPVQDGTFVIIRLDPQASVAELDAQATYEASLIKPLKCLALLSSRAIFGFDTAADRSKLTVELFLVGRGLPAPPTSWASIPISPAPAHPETGRPTMHPTSPLPWPDCHIRTLRSCAAVISRIHTHTHMEAGPRPRLLDDDNDEVSVLAVGDGWDFAHQPRSESPVRPSSPQHSEQPLAEEPLDLESLAALANGSGLYEPLESLATAAVSDASFAFLLPAPVGFRTVRTVAVSVSSTARYGHGPYRMATVAV
ncbi:hypothetical protein EXIGLDRAFT_730851 [Exidia glandulosa HHB12029]|uniref:Uncharacterized protein n=1 Tax=Exidia glandulosa HHB12029 TaxID=1314781 RepID=A0A165C0N2_EXIGL|nr:hypothetical protein EXIGLDRAFT_730851 [Exidia glandulosa HHB12029]